MVKRIWKISKRITSIVWELVKILITLVLILGSLVLYYLHNEPMDAMKYIPEIEQALFPSELGYKLQAEKVELTSDWARDGLIQIDIDHLTVLRKDNTVAFSVPKAQFSYDFWHIITLNYMPSTVLVEKPFLEMIIDETGSLIVKTKENTHLVDIKAFKKLLAQIIAIRELNIKDAHFHLQDHRFKKEWDLQDANLQLKRYFHFSNRARLNATLLGDGVESRLLATATLNRWKKVLSVEMGLDNINLKKISSFIPILAEADLDVQLSAKGEFDITKSHTKITDYITKVQFNAKTLKSGTLNLMGELDNVYYVNSADINGILGTGAKNLKIASSKIILKNEKPTDFYLDVSGIDVLLNQGDSSQLNTTLKATLYDVPTEEVPALWPALQGPDAHAWVKKNLSKGKLTTADFTLYFKGDELVDLLGDIHTKGVRVDYLNPMKSVQDVSAQVLLYPNKVHILVDSGKIDNLSLNKADLLFTDLDKDETWLHIDLDVAGSVTEALNLVATRPLEIPQMMGLNPSLLSGQSKVFVHLSFPLLDDLKLKDIQSVVHADMTQVKVNKPLQNLGLKNGTLTLDVTNEGLVLDGDITLKDSPLHLKWNEYFNAKEVASEYTVSGVVNASDLISILPDLTPWMTGKIALDLSATKDIHSFYSGNLKLDGEKAHINLLPLSVQKKVDLPMITTLHFENLNDKQGTLSFDVRGSLTTGQEDLQLTGSADWNDKNLHVLLSQILAGINQFSGELNATPTDFSLSLKGTNWQAVDLGKISFSGSSSQEKSAPKNISLNIALDEFALNPIKPFREVSIKGQRQNNVWQSFHAQAIASDPFVLVYESKHKQFQGSFADLGDLMERLNISDRFTGGQLSLKATQKENGTLDGQIEVDETSLKETGFLLQAMTILGIVDAFRGEDIVFDEIEVPFVLTPDFKLTLSDAFAIGTNLGVTFKGDIETSQINLSGAVVPAYAINSLPGKIPLLGWLFRDSVGGGLINVPFMVTGPLSNPEVDWEGFKTIAPGALGRLF